MSFVSSSENIGFGDLSQTLSSQFKMGVDTAPEMCGGDMNYANESSANEQSFLQLPDSIFQSKYKIDPNELYMFTDSDIVAGEVTVEHTTENNISADTISEKPVAKKIANRKPNGEMNKTVKKEKVTNGHLKPISKASVKNGTKLQTKVKTVKVTEPVKRMEQIPPPKTIKMEVLSSPTKPAAVEGSPNMIEKKILSPQPAETFLDVFKREMSTKTVIKTEPGIEEPPVKTTTPVAKKVQSNASLKNPKPRKGRGPTVHEALQRIPQRVVPRLNTVWHAPGHQLFDCGALTDTPKMLYKLEVSSDEEDVMPNIGEWLGSMEEKVAETRAARLALRRAALRRQANQATEALKQARSYTWQKNLASILKKEMSKTNSSQIPTHIRDHLLVTRGMGSLLTSREKRKLRTTGWSGGISLDRCKCSEATCSEWALPSCSHCLSHVTMDPAQRLYAHCAAVLDNGKRCTQLLLSLTGTTPLCHHHQVKRESYDRIVRDAKPRKVPRKPTSPANKKPKRRRKPSRNNSHIIVSKKVLTDLNTSVCSDSSDNESGEESPMMASTQRSFIVHTTDEHELEVGEVQVVADDILDSAVLNQIPDEAFAEFFNQEEVGAAFAESSELARALEAVLDEKALDSLTECVSHNTARSKLHVNTSIVEMSSSAPS